MQTGQKRARDDYYYNERGYMVFDDDPNERYRKMKRAQQQKPISPSANQLRIVPYVKRTPGGNVISERKYYDTQNLDFIIPYIDTTWTAGTRADPTGINCLFAPQQGNDISQREGRGVYVYNIKVTGSLTTQPVASTAAPDVPKVYRLILVMDKQTNGVQMTASDLISSGLNAPMLYGFQNTATFGRFQVLKDVMVEMPPYSMAWDGTANVIQSGVVKTFKLKYKWKNALKVDFNSGNAGTVADITNYSFHLLVACTQTTAVSLLNYKSRVSFCG